MILLLGDLHCQFGLVNAQLEHAEQHAGRAIDAVLTCGDLGLFEGVLRKHFRRQGLRFCRPVYFVEGNHEDFALFRTLTGEYADVLHHLPRGSVRPIDGWRVLGLGGASYMDPAATPPGSVIEPADVARALGHAPSGVDLVLSHDSPRGLDIPHAPGFEHYGPPGFEGSEAIRARYRPRVWVFGHHHRVMDAALGETRCLGLAEAWHGYGLLDGQGGYEYVKRFVAKPAASWWKRLGFGRDV